MKHAFLWLLVLGLFVLFFSCQTENTLEPQVNQTDQAANSDLVSLTKKTTTFSGTSEYVSLKEAGTLKILPNGKLRGDGRASVYKDDVSDPRVRGISTWYFLKARINPDGSAKFNGKAELEVDNDGGKWEMSWHGTMAPDGSIIDHVTGTGKEGAVKGLVAKWVYNRPAGMPGYYDVEGYIFEK